MPGVVWPAVPDSAGATMLAMQHQLRQSERWPAATLLTHQFDQLRALAGHAARTVPYYRTLLAEAGVDPGAKDFGPEPWRRIPVLTRSTVQRSEAELTSERIPAAHGKTRTVETSGSTGKPVRIGQTELNAYLWHVFTLREHLWHGRDLGRTLAAIRHLPRARYPAGARADSWGPSTASVYETGPAFGLHIDTGAREQAEWLRKVRPGYLLSMPSNLAVLARYFVDHGLELDGVLEVRTVGEVVTPTLRKACWDTWGTPVVDQYSAQEVGYIAFECPDHDGYHVQCENVYLEVLDEGGERCRPGQTGRVVVTPLHNFAMPLIRYEIGDYAEVGEPCPCGRGHPVLTRIVGRVRNMLTLPSGEQRWPLMGEPMYETVAPVRQFQIVQKTIDGLEVRLVVDEPLTPDQERRLGEIITSSLGHPFELTFTYHDRIPKGAGGKFEDFRSELGS